MELSRPLFAFLDIEPTHLVIIGVVAVLLYGRRLPEVARTAGRGLMQLKQGLRGIQDELTSAINTPDQVTRGDTDMEDRVIATAPKFEPPASESVPSAAAEQPVSTERAVPHATGTAQNSVG